MRAWVRFGHSFTLGQMTLKLAVYVTGFPIEWINFLKFFFVQLLHSRQQWPDSQMYGENGKIIQWNWLQVMVLCKCQRVFYAFYGLTQTADELQGMGKQQKRCEADYLQRAIESYEFV